jgi:hypothetical protein
MGENIILILSHHSREKVALNIIRTVYIERLKYDFGV